VFSNQTPQFHTRANPCKNTVKTLYQIVEQQAIFHRRQGASELAFPGRSILLLLSQPLLTLLHNILGHSDIARSILDPCILPDLHQLLRKSCHVEVPLT